MRADRRTRVGKVMTGYASKSESVMVPTGRSKVVDRLVGEGYRKSSTMETPNELRVFLAYTVSGNVVRPALSSMVRLSKETRPRYVSGEERWRRSGEAGRLRRETTEGRKKGPEARKKGMGGRRRRRVR